MCYDETAGQVTAVVEMPEGADPDDVFCTWLAKQPGYADKNRSREYLLEQPYVWNVMEVEKA